MTSTNDPRAILDAALLPPVQRVLAAQALGVSVPRLMQLANVLLDDPAWSADPRVVQLRARREQDRERRRASGRL